MKKQHDHGVVRRFFQSRLFVIVGLVMSVLIVMANARTYLQDREVKNEIKDLERQIHELDEKKFESIQILSYVTSPQFVEEKARTELLMQKPGEHVVVVSGQNDESLLHKTSVDNSTGQNESNVIRWWRYYTQSR